MKLKQVTAGRISGEIGFLILCALAHIEMFICMGSNFFANLILLILAILFTVIIYIRSIFIGYLIEDYLKDHNILKKDEKRKDNIIWVLLMEFLLKEMNFIIHI